MPSDTADAIDKMVADKEVAETSLGEFDIYTRLYRVHNGAVVKVKDALGKFLLKQKAGNPDSVSVVNNCIKENRFVMPDDGKMRITVKVKVDAAQLSGF